VKEWPLRGKSVYRFIFIPVRNQLRSCSTKSPAKGLAFLGKGFFKNEWVPVRLVFDTREGSTPGGLLRIAEATNRPGGEVANSRADED
jgi:hypothetical protein